MTELLPTQPLVIQLRLTTGESIVGFLRDISLRDQTFVLQRPYKAYTTKILTEAGLRDEVFLVPWFEFEPTNPNVTIPAMHVVTHAILSAAGAAHFMSIITGPPKVNIPTLQNDSEEATDEKPHKPKLN